ncbi:MAG: hypothetical protein MI892_14730, partial [Desulfobacterales bacterium]|nr:hypothetical protein [Desulfobacterales bacterium]
MGPRTYCALLALLTIITLPIQADLIYFNDFEDSVGAEWSKPYTVSPPYNDQFALGRFSNESVSLSLDDLPPHTRLRICFDLSIVGFWNGTDRFFDIPAGPDIWRLSVVNGPTLIETTFDTHIPPRWHETHVQAYPGWYGLSEYPAQTGAVGVNVSGPRDDLYHLDYIFDHNQSSLVIIFASEQIDFPWIDITNNEWWTIDNVSLEIVGKPDQNHLTINSTDHGTVTSPGVGEFWYPTTTTEIPLIAVAEPNAQFVQWIGPSVLAGNVVEPNNPNTTLSADNEMNVTAVFRGPFHLETWTKRIGKCRLLCDV